MEYPTGSNRSHTFIIIHVEGESAPVLLQEGIDYEKTADGLLFTVDSFSPFIIAWEDGTEAPADTPADAAAPSKEATPEKQSEVIKVALPGYVHILLIILPMIGAVVGAFFGAYVGIYYYTRRKENGK